jgi:cyclic pyranopterin phosphate synthase
MQLTPFIPLKLLKHSDRVEASLRRETVYPISAEIDLSNTCPHDCPFCSFGTSASGGYRQQNWVTFPGARMLTLLDELAEVGVKSLTFTGGGEPLVHKQAPAIFEKASEHFEWGLVTNGFLLRSEVAGVIARYAKFVRVSLDSGTPETHHFAHGLPEGQYQYLQILDNMRALREKSDAAHRTERLIIGASFCVMDQNWKEIYQAAKNVKDHGGDYLEVRPTYPTEWRGDGWGKALSSDNYEGVRVELAHARLHLEDESFKIIGLTDRFENAFNENPIKNYSKCRIGDLTTVIGATGEGFHCCVQRGQQYFVYGNFLARSFKDVWNDRARQQMIEGIDISKCPRCRYDGLNEVIEQGFVQDKLHGNFI